MSSPNPPASWYPDPSGAPGLRYWDGQRWTEYTHPTPTVDASRSSKRRRELTEHLKTEQQTAHPVVGERRAAEPDESPRRIGVIGRQGFAKAARWLERRAAGDEEQPAVVIAGPSPLPWTGVARAATAYLAAASAIPAAEQAVDLLRAICGAEDAQTCLLRSIVRDVNLLRVGPFRAAQEHLASAYRKKPEHPDYDRQLTAAQDSLVAALGQTASDEEASIIRYHLGLVALLRHDPTEAEFQLLQSYQLCQSVVRRLVDSTKHLKGKPSTAFSKAARSTGMAAGFTFGQVFFVAGLAAHRAGRKLKETRQDYQVAALLEGYAPFVSAVARTVNAIGGTATQPGLAFHGEFTKGYTLEWTAPEI